MRAALVVDVDGVISPVHGATAWGADVAGGPGLGYLPVSPALNTRLDALAERADVTAAWLTSWDAEMRHGMRFPGASWTTVAHHFADSGPPVYDEDAALLRAGEQWRDCRWWKWWALENWLTEHPEIDAVVWCDDDLGRAFFDFTGAADVEEGWALTRGMFASVELERRGVRALLLAPATATGLTPSALELIENFLRDVSAQSPVRMPTDLQFPSSIGHPGGHHRAPIAPLRTVRAGRLVPAPRPVRCRLHKLRPHLLRPVRRHRRRPTSSAISVPL
ncbi:HAD domain-containing protein [Nocardioides dilutus]